MCTSTLSHLSTIASLLASIFVPEYYQSCGMIAEFLVSFVGKRESERERDIYKE